MIFQPFMSYSKVRCVVEDVLEFVSDEVIIQISQIRPLQPVLRMPGLPAITEPTMPNI